MSDVTVAELAEVVGTPVERLLKQMGEAGLSHGSAEQVVSEEDKKVLLAHLKNSHGDTSSSGSPKRITLKRKTISTLRSPKSQGKKAVSVEVRKKRTYIKRDPAEQRALAEREAAEAAEAEEALRAATAIGDDRLQSEAGQRVVPDSFTHGSSQQRVKWFRVGFETGKFDNCDTFSARSVYAGSF